MPRHGRAVVAALALPLLGGFAVVAAPAQAAVDIPLYDSCGTGTSGSASRDGRRVTVTFTAPASYKGGELSLDLRGTKLDYKDPRRPERGLKTVSIRMKQEWEDVESTTKTHTFTVDENVTITRLGALGLEPGASEDEHLLDTDPECD